MRLASVWTSRLSSSSLIRSSRLWLTLTGSPRLLAGRRAGFSEIHSLVPFQPLVSAEDDVQVPPCRHFELLPKLGIDFVAGQLHWGDSLARATMRCTASASVYFVVNCRSRSISLTLDNRPASRSR